MERLIAWVLAALQWLAGLGGFTYEIDAGQPGDVLGNVVSNVNVWEMGTQFYDAQPAPENDIYEFVEYVQLMQCCGGSPARDLFRDPADRSVLDDYDFSRLIRNCAGILRLGAKPCLKLGSVPEKFVAQPLIRGFGTNVLPPEDYDVWYAYIAALGTALTEAFGRDEVLTWHFTVMTEFENADWFDAGAPAASAEAFCKLYDYAVQALIDTVGPQVYVGAHAMAVTEGAWEEEQFIRHCAQGVNYKTGATGTKLNCLSASYYVEEPGRTGKRKDLETTVGDLRKAAEQYGLTGLDYGVDEGRVLCASPGRDDSQLLSRTVGDQWQAAFDAQLYARCLTNGIGYFSAWSYKSEGLNAGSPTLSFHVARQIAKWRGSQLLPAWRLQGLRHGAEIRPCAAYDAQSGTLRIMAYNYKNKTDYRRSASLRLQLRQLPFRDGEVCVKAYRINDDCNYFDDWRRDRAAYGIGDDCFSWSPDCPNIGGNLIDPAARALYFEQLAPQYAAASQLTPETAAATVRDGALTLKTNLGPNEVVFYEITQP